MTCSSSADAGEACKDSSFGEIRKKQVLFQIVGWHRPLKINRFLRVDGLNNLVFGGKFSSSIAVSYQGGLIHVARFASSGRITRDQPVLELHSLDDVRLPPQSCRPSEVRCPSPTDLAGPDSPGGPGPVPEAMDGPVRLKTLRQTRVKRLSFLPSQCNRGRWDLGLQPGRGYSMGACDAEWDGDVSLRQRHQHR